MKMKWHFDVNMELHMRILTSRTGNGIVNVTLLTQTWNESVCKISGIHGFSNVR